MPRQLPYYICYYTFRRYKEFARSIRQCGSNAGDAGDAGDADGAEVVVEREGDAPFWRMEMWLVKSTWWKNLPPPG